VTIDLHRASELFQSGRVQQAIDLFNEVIEASGHGGRISLAYALGDGQPQVAMPRREGPGRRPDQDVRIRLALSAEGGIDAARAITLLETMPPMDMEAANGLGVAYAAAERHDDAIRAFQRVLALDPTNALAYQNLASMVLRQAIVRGASGSNPALQEAERLARKALDVDPTLAKAHTTLGVVLAQTGRKPEAIDSWKRAVDLDGREFDALYNLTVTLSQAGRMDEARAYARQFVATAPPALYQPSIEQLRAFLDGR
jgi:Flp pilus assembly protein TadD